MSESRQAPDSADSLRGSTTRQITQRRNARHEEIGAAAHVHELRQRGRTPAQSALLRTGERVARRAGRERQAIADQRIALVETFEFRIGEPGRLDEFELPRDVGIEADETQPPLHHAIAALAGRFEHVLTAAAENAMKPGRRNQVVVRMLAAETQDADQPRPPAPGAFREIGVARIGAADMGAVGTGGAVRIVVKGELIAMDDPRDRDRRRESPRR